MRKRSDTYHAVWDEAAEDAGDDVALRERLELRVAVEQFGIRGHADQVVDRREEIAEGNG